MHPRGSKIESQRVKNRVKIAQEGPRSAQEREKVLKSGPRAPQEQPRAPKSGPRAAQERPRESQSRPMRPPEAPWGALGDHFEAWKLEKRPFESDLSRESLEKRVRSNF